MDTDNTELRELLKGFRPVIGNDLHIRIANAVSEISAERKKLAVKKDHERKARGQSVVEQRIKTKEESLVHMLKQANGDKPVNMGTTA